jgi:hypothetical protein
MKKQILTLTMCLALTATSALAAQTAPAAAPVKAPVAAAPATTVKAPVAAVKKAPAKKVVAAKKCTKKCAKKAVKNPVKKVANKQAVPEQVTLTPEQIARQQFEAKMAQERDNFYNKLGLSAEQKTKAEALDKANRESAAPLFDTVRAEKAKLHQLKAQKAGFFAICKQEKAVKAAKKALRAHMDASKKQFEALLTKDQLVKFEAMKLRKCAGPCKCHRHHHGHGHHAVAPATTAAPVAPVAPVAPAAAPAPAAK